MSYGIDCGRRAHKANRIRIRQVGWEFVVEEYRWDGWHIIEALFSWNTVQQAAQEYECEII